MVANSTLPGWILLNFKPIRGFMVERVNCKNEDPIKNGAARVLTRFPPL